MEKLSGLSLIKFYVILVDKIETHLLIYLVIDSDPSVYLVIDFFSKLI